MDGIRFQSLTEAQRACLRRVFQHMTSKDIARELGISPHTVDQRLRVAARALGVAGRVEAARLLAHYEGLTPDVYQQPAYQAPAVAPAEPPASVTEATAGEQHPVEREYGEHARERQLSYQAFVPEPSGAMSLPFPTRDGEENKLGPWQRLGWMAAIAVGSALSFGAVLAGLEALASLL